MFICATAGVREILNKGPLKVCFAINTFCPPLRLCIYFADANNWLSTVKQWIWTTKLRSSFTRITWFVESTSKTACLWIQLQETLLYTMQYRRCLPFPVASHRLHFLTALNSLLDSSVLKTCQVMIDKLFHVLYGRCSRNRNIFYLIRWHYGKPSTRIWRQRCWHRAAFYTHDR